MAVSYNTVLWIGISTIFQLIGVSFMPASRGMTLPGPTAIMVVSYVIGIYSMARVVASGVELGLLVPLMTLLIIFGSIAVGMIFYGSNPSAPKLAFLGGAAVMITLASRY